MAKIKLKDCYKGYNRKRHLDLLKIEYLGLETTERLVDRIGELSRYAFVAQSQFNWYLREQYCELIENFLEGDDKGVMFYDSLLRKTLFWEDLRRNLESNLVVFSPDPKSFEFSDLLEEIFDLCEWEFHSNLSEVERKSEAEFRDAVEKIYCKMKEYLKNYLDQ